MQHGLGRAASPEWVMQRRHAIGALTWGAMVALTLVWWTPSLLLAVARWQGGRARFGAVMMLGRALVAMGLLGAASQLYAAEAERATQAMRAIRAGQRW
jgi:hypothetical protein